METQQHTIFGAGQVGQPLAIELAAQGHAVRLVRRSAPGEAIDGVEWMQGDATDPAFAAKACEGSVAVYNCTNAPDYGRWDGVLQPLYRAIWDAAAGAGARLVQLDNLYMYGRPPRLPFDERTPMHPCSPHGELRKALNEELWARHRRGDLEVTVGHASDFFGPGASLSAVIRPDVLEAMISGGRVYQLGDVDTPHGYTYTPDVVRGLATLGTHREAVGRAWHLPTTSTASTRTLLEVFARHAGTELKVSVVPAWALKLASVFSPMLGSLLSMRYQWDVPYVLDDSDFCRTFGIEPTPLDTAVAQTFAGFSAQAEAKAA
ncbi:MAG: NAD-dependent epimerase/dehydratase family protein [Nannocystaceae bacterium]|nr:NAD-dependent epimerase/dehydratase family protein [Nannocystaceae bacterium]